MENTNQHTKIAEGRQTFIKTMLVLAAGSLVGKWFGAAAKSRNKPMASGEKVKMLTADGKLVEIDRAYIKKKGHKASSSDILTWLKRNV